jgi:alkylhydroperoxidase/carboxymuconolactone decarboxylase family protein YurZ
MPQRVQTRFGSTRVSYEPKPPARYNEFIERYPKLGDAWRLISEAGADASFDARTARLIKLGIAIGALREGAVHASVRKGVALGLSPQELEQVVALAAGTLGLPATVAAYSWVKEVVLQPVSPVDDGRGSSPRGLERLVQERRRG